MVELQANCFEIEPYELVHFLLRETGQNESGSLNVNDVLELLKLSDYHFDFDSPLFDDVFKGRTRPRALLIYPSKTIAIHSDMSERRIRFSTLHEVAHYVLPKHGHLLYLCEDVYYSQSPNNSTSTIIESEANDFAVDLLFKGDLFTIEANSHPVTAKTVKDLATKYNASFEATARRLIEKNLKECMFLVFKRKPGPAVSNEWIIKYCVSSPSFRAKFFSNVSGTLKGELVEEITKPTRDIANSIFNEIRINSEGTEHHFKAEIFSNTYNLFYLLTLPR